MTRWERTVSLTLLAEFISTRLTLPRLELDESASDAGSEYEISTLDKGKAREGNGEAGQYGVDFKVLSIERLLEIQQTEIDHVAGIVGIKVRTISSCSHDSVD